MSFQKKIVENFIKVGALKYSGLVVTFIGSAVISRQLTPAEYGVQAIGAIFYGVMSLFLDAGFTIAVIREINNKKFQRSLKLFVVISGLALSLLLAALAFPIAWWYNDPRLAGVVLLYAVCLVLTALPIVEEAVLSREQKFTFIAQVSLASTVIHFIVTYFLAINGFGYYSLIIPLLLAPLFKYFIYFKKVGLVIGDVRNLPLSASFNRVKTLIVSFSKFRVLAYAAANVDNFYVSKVYNEDFLGLYNRAYSFNRLPVQIVTGVVNTIQLPMFQKLIEEGKSVKNEFGVYVQLLGAIGFPAVLAFHLFPSEISVFIWGENWKGVGDYLYPLSILLPTTMMLNACGNLFVLFRGEKLLVWNSIVSALGMVVGASIGILFSIESMIVGIITGSLLGSLPITIYLGFYKLFGFSFKEIVEVWWFNYLTVFALLVSYLIGVEELKYAVLAIYTLGSLYSLIVYIKKNYFV